MSKRARRTASVCLGAFILADAGLLEGKRAATHWHWVNELQTRHPNVRVDPESIWVEDQGIYNRQRLKTCVSGLSRTSASL
ncbi:hypothetical protein SBC1_40330 (plasmid) [Caballeronia sp. SBC1]|uniref:DJ-1/PfpI family protein n=3 Tax=unclassified Caballeronia TaxID=2646786 RepID=UPI00140E8F4F|nr:DJ-1/PfpI family protein [Caballeronia sp. SBC1]QIN63993.1 hypothetical protein SBC1_40330 [Caballeronia sp. SBC1]